MMHRIRWNGGKISIAAWIFLLTIAGCRFSPRSPSEASPFANLPLQRIWSESFSAAWSGWAPQALACAHAGSDTRRCLRALRPTLTERVVEEAARRKEALGIDAPYVASILGGYAQRPEQAAALIVLAMSESTGEDRRARLQAAFEAIPRRFERFSFSFRSARSPLSHPGAGEDPRRWAQYYLAQEWALLRAAVAAWRPPAEEEVQCARLASGEDLCAFMARVRSPEDLPALEARLEEFFRGAFDYADAFARSERFLQKDPAAVRALLSEMLREAREKLIPLEREVARQRLNGESPSINPLESAWDEVEHTLFGPSALSP
ncbi:hypothetical protein HRbin22_01600 [Candidatus Thermoflexus japonica]|uniref:Uncharacterized protein n=1 Tax=Candidatus Thermoflexus japonica TaxID=2035417 RepID=A0A2H5Y7D3_9CHLR|nr:hypothetical protein HRbin22_01600 [Candidatus Thermoflexus japonica]